jgi:hypothetical protein
MFYWWGYLLAFLFLMIAFLMLYSLRFRRDRTNKGIPTYACNDCGEQECICSKETGEKQQR